MTPLDWARRHAHMRPKRYLQTSSLHRKNPRHHTAPWTLKNSREPNTRGCANIEPGTKAPTYVCHHRCTVRKSSENSPPKEMTPNTAAGLQREPSRPASLSAQPNEPCAGARRLPIHVGDNDRPIPQMNNRAMLAPCLTTASGSRKNRCALHHARKRCAPHRNLCCGATHPRVP